MAKVIERIGLKWVRMTQNCGLKNEIKEDNVEMNGKFLK